MLLTSSTVVTGSSSTKIFISPSKGQISEDQLIFVNGISSAINRTIALPCPPFTQELEITEAIPQTLEQGTKLNLNGEFVWTAELVEAGQTIIPIFPVGRIISAGDVLSWDQILGQPIRVTQFIPEGSSLIYVESTAILPPEGSSLIWEIPQYVRPFYFVGDAVISLGLGVSVVSYPKTEPKDVGISLGLGINIVIPNPEPINLSISVKIMVVAERENPPRQWIYLNEEELVSLTSAEFLSLT